MRTPRRLQTGNTNREEISQASPPKTRSPRRSQKRPPRQFTERGVPKYTEAEQNGTVVHSRANWDELRKEAGIYQNVEQFLPPRHDVKAVETCHVPEHLLCNPEMPGSAVSQPLSERSFRTAPTPAEQAVGLGEMSATEVANWLTYKVADSTKDIGRAFKYYDRDGSGAIDYEEFRAFLSHRYNLMINDFEFHKLMREVDDDHSGEVDYTEFVKFFQKKSLDPALWGSGSGQSWQVMKEFREKIDNTWGSINQAFNAVDTDHSGALDYQEFKEVLSKWFVLNEDEAISIYSRFDQDNSGSVSMDEFRQGLRDAVEGAGLQLKKEESQEAIEARKKFLVAGHPLAAGTVGGIQGFLTRDIMNVKRQELGGIKNAMYSSTPLAVPRTNPPGAPSIGTPRSNPVATPRSNPVATPRSNPMSAQSTGTPRRGVRGGVGEFGTTARSPCRSAKGGSGQRDSFLEFPPLTARHQNDTTRGSLTPRGPCPSYLPMAHDREQRWQGLKLV